MRNNYLNILNSLVVELNLNYKSIDSKNWSIKIINSSFNSFNISKNRDCITFIELRYYHES